MISLLGYLVFQIDFLAIAASLLFGAFASSILLGRLSLSGIEISISSKQIRARSGEIIDARLRLENKNRLLPIFHPTLSVREEDTLQIQAFQYHGTIAPGQSVELSITPIIRQRGLRRLEVFAPRSLFPFALHQTLISSQTRSPEIIVWPKAEEIDFNSLFNDPPRFRFETLGEQSLHSNDVEAARIREYQLGDSRHHINWKLSAKIDKLTIIEPRDERKERYELHLDTSKDLWPSELVFERMLRLVTGLVSELSRRKIIQGITVDNAHYPLRSNRERIRFFDALATIQASLRNREEPHPVRNQHLWILPASQSGIMLAHTNAVAIERSTSA